MTNLKMGDQHGFLFVSTLKVNTTSKNLRETAFLKLQTTFYRGQTRTFTFEKYTNIHKDAHRMLEDAGYNNGQGLDNETKVQFFKNGIKAEGGLEHALSIFLLPKLITSRCANHNSKLLQTDTFLALVVADVAMVDVEEADVAIEEIADETDHLALFHHASLTAKPSRAAVTILQNTAKCRTLNVTLSKNYKHSAGNTTTTTITTMIAPPSHLSLAKTFKKTYKLCIML